MKRSFGIGFLALLFTVSMYAAQNTQKVVFRDSVQVGSTKLPAGEYKVTWTGTGAAAQLTLTAGKTSATVPAQVVEVKSRDSEIHTATENGVEVLHELQFEKVKLVVKSAPQSGN